MVADTNYLVISRRSDSIQLIVEASEYRESF